METNTETYNWIVSRVWENLEQLSHKWDVFINPSHQDSEIYAEGEVAILWEPEVISNSKKAVYPRCNRTDAHMNSQWQQHTQDTYSFKSERVPALRGLNGVPHLTQNLFETKCYWVYQPHYRACPMPRSSKPIQNGLINIFCRLFISF